MKEGLEDKASNQRQSPSLKVPWDSPRDPLPFLGGKGRFLSFGEGVAVCLCTVVFWKHVASVVLQGPQLHRNLPEDKLSFWFQF